MKVSTNHTGNAIDRGAWATRDISPAKAKSITESDPERRFWEVLIALLFAIIAAIAAIASVVLIHLSASLVPPELLRIAFNGLL